MDTNNTNNTAGGDDLILLYNVVYGHMMPILIAAGVLTNLINILTLWSVSRRPRRNTQSATYRYLFWLAVTDLMASLSVVLAIVYLDRSDLPYAWASYYAHLETPLMNGLTSASVYIVVGLSVDRYIAVCLPILYKDASAPRMATVRIACSFIVPVLLYLPQGFFMQVVANKVSGYTYAPVQALYPGAEYWQIFVELCHRIFPASILVVLNSRIIYSFNKATLKRRQMKGRLPVSAKASSANKQNEEKANNSQEKKLVNLLVAIVICFLLTTLPSAVLTLVDFDGADHGSFRLEIFRAVSNCLETLGLSLNYVLYFVFVSDVREAQKNVLCGLVSQAKKSRACSNYPSSANNSKATECVEL